MYNIVIILLFMIIGYVIIIRSIKSKYCISLFILFCFANKVETTIKFNRDVLHNLEFHKYLNFIIMFRFFSLKILLFLSF